MYVYVRSLQNKHTVFCRAKISGRGGEFKIVILALLLVMDFQMNMPFMQILLPIFKVISPF